MKINKKTTTVGETVSISYRHGEADFSDLVYVVRCKDCKHYAKETDGLAMPMYICKRFTEWEIDETENLELAMKPDDFCSYGERKEE